MEDKETSAPRGSFMWIRLDRVSWLSRSVWISAILETLEGQGHNNSRLDVLQVEHVVNFHHVNIGILEHHVGNIIWLDAHSKGRNTIVSGML